MLLENEARLKYFPEITKLYAQELGELPIPGLIYFISLLEDPKQTLKAVASLKNYMGSWYLRGCVVKPEFRGQGLQKVLIKERLSYLSDKTPIARVSVYPDNLPSIRNIKESGFLFEKRKRLKNGHEVLVYKFDLSSRNS